ncbi:MAG: ArgE/DapE family deacylase [Candidatus Bathyarchaeia archaeon]
MSKTEILSRVRSNRGDIIELAKELIRTPSENPPGDQTRVAALVRDFLKDHGVSVETYEREKGRINVIGRIGRGSGRILLMNGHMDTVPVGDVSRWSFDPFEGKLVDGILYGRGAADMKGGLAAMLYAQAILVEFEGELNGSMVTMAVPDEETGGKFGTEYLLKEVGIRGSACIVAEPSLLKFCRIGEKGWCLIRIAAKGRPAHGSLPMLGKNAILMMCEAIRASSQIASIKAKAPEELAEVVEFSKEVIREVTGKDECGDALDHFTINYGTIRGGTKANVVADSCVMEVDVRIPLGSTADFAFETLSKLVKAKVPEAELERISYSDPTYTNPDEESITTLRRNAFAILGFEPRLFVQQSATDARFFRREGIPAYSFGPGDFIRQSHAIDERVEADDIVKAAEVYALTAFDYLS